MRYFISSFIVAALVFLTSCKVCASVVEINSPEQLKAEVAKPGPMLLMYSADWCGACQVAKPLFKEAGKKNNKVRFLIVDSDKTALKEHAKLFNYIPFFLFGKDENTLRNKPCVQPDDLERTEKGFNNFINKCLENK